MQFFISISNLSYSFPNGKKLFENLNINVSSEKVGLTGDNGCGKTTLLKLISGELKQASGSIKINGTITKFEQDQSNLSGLDVVEVLGVKNRLAALEKITAGLGREEDFLLLNDNWDIEQKIDNILRMFGLSHISRERKFSDLSGGEAERLMFAACLIKNPDFILFDEPTNHLDLQSREAFYQIIKNYKKGLLVVSHDKQLLRQMDRIIELSDKDAKTYGGNYDFYCEQKQIEKDAINQKINTAGIELRKQIKVSSLVISSKEGKNNLGEQRRENTGISKGALNKRKNNSEKTLAGLISVHKQKIEKLSENLCTLENNSSRERLIKLDFDKKSKSKGKCLVSAVELNFKFDTVNIWDSGLSFQVNSADRVLLSGCNGSGKTTLVNLIVKKIIPSEGNIRVNCSRIGVIDQKYDLLLSDKTILENIQTFAVPGMPEHELRIRLARFLFFNDDAVKITRFLSGGEKCRLMMACLLAASNTPELIILDEPTNNLDLKSISQMESALSDYPGALIVISHDRDFVENIGITKTINLDEISLVSKTVLNKTNIIFNNNLSELL
jgi:ATPase subunit of ABC transporter with duplicated ATPase domains